MRIRWKVNRRHETNTNVKVDETFRKELKRTQQKKFGLLNA